jgi:hypothetical protein
VRKESPRDRLVEILTTIVTDLSDIAELCDQADEELETTHSLRDGSEADV